MNFFFSLPPTFRILSRFIRSISCVPPAIKSTSLAKKAQNANGRSDCADTPCAHDTYKAVLLIEHSDMFERVARARDRGSFKLALQRRSFTPLYPSASSHACPHLVEATLFAAGHRARPHHPPPLRKPLSSRFGNLIRGLSAILPHPSRSMLVKRWARVRARALCDLRIPPPPPSLGVLRFSRRISLRPSLSFSLSFSLPLSLARSFATLHRFAAGARSPVARKAQKRPRRQDARNAAPSHSKRSAYRCRTCHSSENSEIGVNRPLSILSVYPA